MVLDITTDKLYKRILDERNIYSAIFCMESYIFDKGLLDTVIPITIDEGDEIKEILAKNDLELYYALFDKHNVELIEKVIGLCQDRLRWLLEDKSNIFSVRVFFKLKSYDNEILKFRPLHTSRLIDLICMVSILIQLMYDDNYEEGKRNLSDLSKLVPHNFYGNIPSTNVQHLFHKWQKKYKEYTEDVIERCRLYQSNHNYLTEVSLDIKDFFPSISPKLLYDYVIKKLSSTYKDNLDVLKMVVAKLLFFHVEKEYVEPWQDYYYSKRCETADGGLYLNCGIPQGLPQSYFFGNLCMIEVKNLLMKDECFKGDAYFYVDDSVIYIQAELKNNDFKKRINLLNKQLEKCCLESEEYLSDIGEYIAKDYLDFHQGMNYKIEFHEDEKSIFTPIDAADNRLGPIAVFAKEVSLSSNLTWNLDEIDDQVSLEKLMALDKVITREITELKKAMEEQGSNLKTDSNLKNRVTSRLKLLRRFKKFFLYRKRLLKIREVGGPNEEITEDFKKRLLSKEISLSDWFEQNDEDIFQSEYRLIIQKESKNNAEKLCEEVQAFEKLLLRKAKIKVADDCKSLFFSKDVHAAVYMKSLVQDSYVYLIRWAKENFSGLKSLNQDSQMKKFRDFLNKDPVRGLLRMMEYGFDRKHFTLFVMKASAEFQRRILNVFFSEVIGVLPSDALTFTKTNSRKLYYTELRILTRLRNRDFDLEKFEEFVEHIDDKDVSNRMIIDMGLLDVLNKFIIYVKKPERVDDLILTHRLTKGLWYNGSKFLNSYTLHNEEHAVSLINKSMELINRIDYFMLKDVDYFILFLACYLHDISMVIHPNLGKFSSGTGKNLVLISELMDQMNSEVKVFYEFDSRDKKNTRMKKAGNFIIKVFNDVYNYFENEVRENHASDSAKFIREGSNSLLSYMEPTLLSFVAKVSESHGYDVRDVYGLKSRAKDDTVSLKYLIMLIRLADLMDVASDRVNYHLLRQNLTHLSLTSKFHWISHLVTDRIELKTNYSVPEGEERKFAEKPIIETINLNLHLNFQQLTTVNKTEKCKFCDCTMADNCITISISNNGKPVGGCSQDSCTILCQWMIKKHEWLISELVALNEYLFSVNNSMFETSIKLNIYYCNDRKLDPDMFDSVQEYLGIS